MTLSEKLAQIAADQGQVLSVTERDGVTCTLRQGPDPLVPALARALGVAVAELYGTSRENNTPYGDGASRALAEIEKLLEGSAP